MFSFKNLNEVEEQLLTDNTEWQKAGFELNTLGTIEMLKNPVIHQKLIDTYNLIKSKTGSGDAFTRAHYHSLEFKIKRALEK